MPSRDLLLILCPALPLAAALLIGVLGPRWLRHQSHWLSILGIGGAFVAAGMLLADLRSEIRSGSAARAEIGIERIVRLWTWIDVSDAYGGNRLVGVDGQRSRPRERAPGLPEASTEGPVAKGRLPFRVEISLRYDPLTAIMLVMVNFVALLVAIYAAGYMRGDRGYFRFFAFVSLFVFSMNMLVTASNFLQLFVFWEAVGVCSYLLIGFWYQRTSAAAAGMKAFLVNRVGDFGFALAMFLIWLTYGTLDFHDSVTGPGVLGQARLATEAYVGGGLGLTICLLLMLGACGKSAQFPLHVWLADAMEGPTPVSALIHAATMVTAGVYMVARCTPLFMVSPTAQVTVACIGAGTALMAGLIALTQFDLKRVLAYSTLSQLGYMFLALGVGTAAGIRAGVFHLFTHAFFKALLFLGAGSVMHAMGNVIDIRKFAGLRTLMPKTCWTFAVGCLALAGIAPLSGFWSKDAILASVRDQAAATRKAMEDYGTDRAGGLFSVGEMPSGHGSTSAPGSSDTTDPAAHQSGSELSGDERSHGPATRHLSQWSLGELRCAAATYRALYIVALVTAFLTAVYTFRAFYLTFFGALRVPPEAGHHAHESPPVMWIPLAVLAAFAIGVGWFLETGHRFANFLSLTPSLQIASIRSTEDLHLPHGDIALLSSLLAVAGIAVASYLFLGSLRQAEWFRAVLSSPWLGAPYRWSSGKFYWDEIYQALIVRPLRQLAAICFRADRTLVDGVVDAVGGLPRLLGGATRRWQRGLTSYYGLMMVLGVIAVICVQWIWSTS